MHKRELNNHPRPSNTTMSKEFLYFSHGDGNSFGQGIWYLELYLTIYQIQEHKTCILLIIYFLGEQNLHLSTNISHSFTIQNN